MNFKAADINHHHKQVHCYSSNQMIKKNKIYSIGSNQIVIITRYTNTTNNKTPIKTK